MCAVSLSSVQPRTQEGPANNMIDRKSALDSRFSPPSPCLKHLLPNTQASTPNVLRVEHVTFCCSLDNSRNTRGRLMTHVSLDDKVATACCPIHRGKAKHGLLASEEGNFWCQACVCPTVHLIAGSHKVLCNLQVAWLSLLSSFNAMMMPQGKQTCSVS